MVSYAIYIRSKEWRERRKPIFERANGYCERCFQSPPKEVHHRSYLHLGNELDSELMAVCQPCHKFLEESAGGRYGPRKIKKKKAKKAKHTRATSPKWRRYQAKLRAAAERENIERAQEAKALTEARLRCGRRRAKEALIAKSRAFWAGKCK